MPVPPVPQITLEQFEHQYRDRHLLHGAIDHWAARMPGRPAIVNASRGTTAAWLDLQRGSMALAGELKRMGFRKGDILAASLPFLTEHVLLEYACFRLGVIHAPLDLRLQPAELVRCLGLVRARGYAFLGKTPAVDFSALGEAVRGQCGFIEHFIQFSPPGEVIGGAVSFAEVFSRAMSPANPVLNEASPGDGAQVIFTTGSTGSPKPALLSHRGIACQNLCLGTAFGFRPGARVLNNVPASHVGGQAELLMTSLFTGSVCVLLEVFDPARSLAAIEEHGVTLLGQIPAMYQMEWRSSEYGKRNLGSLETAVYGGQSVSRPFLDKMLTMAPKIGGGLGLTECSGFCTYTPLTPDAGVVAASIGWAMPVYPATIRRPMEGGRAGEELPAGETGHICFTGPQNFLGYVNDPEATARTLAPGGILYTGDLGSAGEGGLQYRGRAKWVIKPAGYHVFPGDVERHFGELEDKVASIGVVGHEHGIWSEGIIAFIEKKPGAEVTEAELRRHARRLTSYMRPLHYVVLDPGAMPLNRSAKVDVTRLQQLAKEEVARLRERGRWDGGGEAGEA
jgi:acyl-CoA synthetase (AMP-forming)/AMP-acid ligase II